MARIKICGLHTPEDVAYANEVRPDWVGFVVNCPVSHRSVTPDELRALRAGLEGDILAAGVFVDEPVETVAGLLHEGVISAAQLHGNEDEQYISSLRAAAPGGVVIKAFKVRGSDDMDAARASSADLVLLDAGQGEGRTFDWSLVGELDRPYLLAGGLTPEGISKAIEALDPYGVDISTGVETDRSKDPVKMRAATEAARGQ